MKITTTLSLIACLFAGQAFSQGFGMTPTNWSIPQGGHISSNFDYGFDALGYSAGGTLGNQSWSVLDINGDGRPDIVVTAETVEFEQFANQAIAFGSGSNRYWKVYLNNGNGFNSTPINWPLPQGGHISTNFNYGFDALAYSAGGTLGNQSWSVIDMNSDNKPDLVVTAETVEFEQFANQAIAFGSGSNRYWKVYLNNGNGFNPNPINWPLPQGGHISTNINYGFDALAYSAGGTVGNQSWSIIDMNNDNKPDLVVTAETVEFEQFANQAIAFGTGNNRYWKVYMNTGSGFNPTPINWPLPQGGHISTYINYGFDALADTAGSTLGDQTWSVVDMNADGRPDIVVTAQTVEFTQFSNQPIAFGTGANRYWKVYLNTGSGFNTTAVNWPIPQGGKVSSTIPYGFNALAGFTSGGDIGNQTWSILDMNSDNRPDLVVAAEVKAVSGYSNQSTAFGPPNAKYWKVYLNNGNGFNLSASNWPLPQGGEVDYDIDYGYNALAAQTTGGDAGNQSWSVLDMNNDNKPDLVVTAESVEFEQFSNQAVAFGSGSNRYWKVYMNNSVLETLHFTSADDGIVVYPNPSQGIFNVKMPKDVQASFDVNDLSGRTILNSESETIDLSAFPRGIYILKVYIGQQSHSKKLILK